MLHVLEWTGCATGVLGALLLALNNRWSGYGYVSYLLANLLWIAFGVLTLAPGLVAMQSMFMVTTLIGIRNWLFFDRARTKDKVKVSAAPPKLTVVHNRPATGRK